MKKLLSVVIVLAMTVALFAFAAGAEDDTIEVDLEYATGNIDVEYDDGKLICTTTGSDPWVSIPVDEIDTSVYKFFTVRYSATEEVGSNNTYLQDTEVNTGYSGTAGTWAPHRMNGTADGAVHEVTYSIEDNFPKMVNTKLTGVRFTCGGAMDGVFTVESLVFSKNAPGGVSSDPEVQSVCFDVATTEGDTFSFRGWVIVAHDTIADLGYRIDNEDAVFSSLNERSAEVSAVIGSDPAKTNGFIVELNAADLSAGQHTIHVVVKTTSGAILDVNPEGQDGFVVTGTAAEPGTVPATEPETAPATGDMTVAVFAAVAVLAMGAAMVFMKKRAF